MPRPAACFSIRDPLFSILRSFLLPASSGIPGFLSTGSVKNIRQTGILYLPDTDMATAVFPISGQSGKFPGIPAAELALR